SGSGPAGTSTACGSSTSRAASGTTARATRPGAAKLPTRSAPRPSVRPRSGSCKWWRCPKPPGTSTSTPTGTGCRPGTATPCSTFVARPDGRPATRMTWGARPGGAPPGSLRLVVLFRPCQVLVGLLLLGRRQGQAQQRLAQRDRGVDQERDEILL